jgi:hypothetical protein
MRSAIESGTSRPLELSALSSALSESPSTHSRATKGMSPCMPTSRMATTLGCRISESSLASSRNMWTNARSADRFGKSVLSATTSRSPLRRSRDASQTTAMPPLAIWVTS